MKAILLSMIVAVVAFAISLEGLNINRDADYKIIEDNLEKLKARCEAREGKACRFVSLFYSSKYLESRYEAEFGKLRVEYAFKGCDLRDGPSCLTIAVEYGDAHGYRKVLQENPEKYVEFLHKACEYNEINSCNLLGHHYYREADSKKGSEKKAAKIKSKHFYKKACKLGHDIACKEK
ncbi:hypothetical protein ACWIUD_03080 [Helicobacter sp. 23-1044]